MSENVLVTGATGKVGRELVRRLLDRGVGVLAGTRSPARARSVFADDVDVVELDYHRADTYDGALHWADRVFLVPAPFDPNHYTTLVSFMDWAVQTGIGHLVLLSAMGVERVDDLHLRKVERHVHDTGVAWTFLRPNWLMQNFSVGYIPERIRDGLPFALPAGDAKVSFVDVRDVADVAAEVLTSDRHHREAFTLTGPQSLDHHEAARVMGEVSGRDVTYEPVDGETMREILMGRGRSGTEADVIVRAYGAMRDGYREEVTSAVSDLLGREPVSFQAFAEEHAGVWA